MESRETAAAHRAESSAADDATERQDAAADQRPSRARSSARRRRVEVSGREPLLRRLPRGRRTSTMTIEPNKVTALIGSSGCGKTTFLRSLNRMHELTPGARVEGEVTLDGQDIYAPGVDPVEVRRLVGMVFQAPNPFPTMSIYENVAAGLDAQQPEAQEVREGRGRRALAARRPPLGRGQGPARQARLGPLRRPAAAALHRPRDRGRARGPADGRALLGARPDRHAGDRGPDRRAEEPLHDRDRHAQHAAGGARQRHRPRSSTSRRPASPGGWSRSDATETDLHQPRRRRRPRTTSAAGSAERPRCRRLASNTRRSSTRLEEQRARRPRPGRRRARPHARGGRAPGRRAGAAWSIADDDRIDGRYLEVHQGILIRCWRRRRRWRPTCG